MCHVGILKNASKNNPSPGEFETYFASFKFQVIGPVIKKNL